MKGGGESSTSSVVIEAELSKRFLPQISRVPRSASVRLWLLRAVAVAMVSVENEGSPSAGSPSKVSEPLIFLDIDGVICCNYHCQLEVDKLQQLRRICKATGASVVLSSDWRRQLPMKQKVQRALQRLGITYVGCTSIITEVKQVGNWRMETNHRPREIIKWLGARSVPWVAIDDRDLISETDGDRLQGHFVRTDFIRGLSAAAADEAIAILRGHAVTAGDGGAAG